MREFSYLFFENKYGCVLLYAPILYAIFFGLMFSNQTLKNVPIVIYDQDQSAASRNLIQSFFDSERFDVIAIVSNEEDMINHLADDNASAALEIPIDFAKKIKAKKKSSVLLEINAVNIMYPNTVQLYASEIISTYNSKILEPGTYLPINFSTRILYNPTSSYSSFILPGLVTNSIQISLLLSACLAFVREFDSKTLWTSYSLLTIITGKLILYWFLSILAGSIGSVICINFFNIAMRGNFMDILLIYSAFSFVICNFAFFISALAVNHRQPISPLVLLYIMPSFIYSGYTWPDIAKPMFVYIYSRFLPMTYTADTVRDIMLIGFSNDLYKNSIILYLSGIVLMIATVFVCRRRNNKKNND